VIAEARFAVPVGLCSTVMPRLAPPLALVIAAAGPAAADAPRPAPAPCVNRELTEWRQVRDVALDGKALAFCTGDDCWSFDLATRQVSAAPARPPAGAPPLDPAGLFTDGHGVTLATADATHAVLCAQGVAVPASCKVFRYHLPIAAAGVFPRLNAARTLGTVQYDGVGDNDAPVCLFAFDLTSGRQLGELPGASITPLDHGFLVDDQALYSAAFRPVGALAAPDQRWVPLGGTDRIALRDEARGELVIQRTTTGQVEGRVRYGAPRRDTHYRLVATADGATLYAIGSASAEGEVLVVDTAAAKIVARATAPVCAAGTRRAN
jgi:hypothetical protein